MRPLYQRLIAVLLIVFVCVALLWIYPISRVWQFLFILAAVYMALWCAVFLLSSMNLQQTFIRFIITSFSLVFTVVILEVCAAAKLLDYRLVFKTLEPEPWKNPLNKLDKELLHIHKGPAHLTGIQPYGDITQSYHVSDTNQYPYDATFDSNGFRNDKEISQADLVVVGDSFIEAATVSQQEMLTSVLARLQEREVANLGQLWYGPQQEFFVLKRFGLKLKPKVLVWAFFGGNDLTDFHRYEEATKDWDNRSAGFHSLKTRSFSKNALLAGFSMIGKPKLRDPAPYCTLNAGSVSGTKMYFYYKEAALSEKFQATLKRVLNILKEAEELTRENGVQLVVAYLPSKYQVYHDLCDPNDSYIIDNWELGHLTTHLKNGIAEISDTIGYVDLTESLQSKAKSSPLLYFTDDTHWTVLGNEISAQALSDYIDQQGYLNN